MEKKIKLLIIDEKRCSIEVEVNAQDFKRLNIEKDNVIQHKSKRQLLLKVSEYLDSFEI